MVTKISVNMSVGISNLEIEKIFKSISNDDLDENFRDVFSSNKK